MGGVLKDTEQLNRDLCKVGAKVYYWEPNHAWAVGEIEEVGPKHFVVRGLSCSASQTDKLQTCKLGDDKVWPVREDVLDEDVDDLLDLTVLHDATIQRCLYTRYMKDIVYTNIGAIVVALNPWNFKIPWYMDDKMPDYLREGEIIKENRPHSWAQAHNTWHDMRRDCENQTILISGESGAGKTEAAKIVMKYLGALSCMLGEETDKDKARKVAFNINQASPVLEGFGNAKTVRNDNSSRFGKFMKVQFNEAGNLVGAFTIKYLLEKSRIVTASPNERVYHAFYLLTKGKDAGKYHLGPPEEYHCNAGKCCDIPGVDDGDDYRICLEAMANCGFSDEDIDGVWRIVGGILHGLRITFRAIDEDSCEVDPASDTFIDRSCSLWKTSTETLKRELVTTTIETRDGPVVQKLTTVKAADGRDAICKAAYDAVFGWEVNKINQKTDTGSGESFIGLLDIFGFEDFEHNSFEQICINLANETLQNHYNTFIFTKDMEECRSEGIDVTQVKCPDNSPCLRMLVDKLGIFGLLDDECSMGKGSDQGFLDKVLQHHSSNDFFAVKKLAKDSFIVHHYAASVNYTVDGWLDKNRDTLKPALKHFMRASEHPLIKDLIPEPDDNARKVTVGGFFKDQLNTLMALINSTSPHWIRCVKPHPAKKPLMLHGITAMTQLESSGVLGTVKIRKAGYPVRPSFKKFLGRFKVIIPGPYPPLDSPDNVLAECCKKVLEAAGLASKARAQIGKTRVFLKNEANQALEAVREKALAQHVHCIHQNARARLAQQKRRVKLWLWCGSVIKDEVRDWLTRTSATREEIRRRRQELNRLLAAEQQKVIGEEENERLDLEAEALDTCEEIWEAFREDGKFLRQKLQDDELVRQSTLTEALHELEGIFLAFLPQYDVWRGEMTGLLLLTLQSVEQSERRAIPQQQAKEWEELLQVAEYEFGSVQLHTLHHRERFCRMLLCAMERVQRQEMDARCGMLQVYIDSLEECVEPWLESLGAVKYWSEIYRKRQQRLTDTRELRQDLAHYDQQASHTVHSPIYRDPIATDAMVSPTKTAWVGCTGVPDKEQLGRIGNRPPLARPEPKKADPYPLDGSSSDPRRDASPLRSARSLRCPSPRRGSREVIIAKTPIPADLNARTRAKNTRLGLKDSLHNLGKMTEKDFLLARAMVVKQFNELKEEGKYPFDGAYAHEENITTQRELRMAKDVLHDLLATYCMELQHSVVSLSGFIRRNQVFERHSVTGKWKPMRVTEWSASNFHETPNSWKKLKEEKLRLEAAIRTHKLEMLRILRAATEEGHQLVIDPDERLPFTEIQYAFEQWARRHSREMKGSECEIFERLSRLYSASQPHAIPPASPTGRSARTSRAHLESVSPRRKMVF